MEFESPRLHKITERHNGCGLTRSLNSNTTTYQDERQPRAVELMQVRRATARGSHDISARKGAGFSPELGSPVCEDARLPTLRRPAVVAVCGGADHRRPRAASRRYPLSVEREPLTIYCGANSTQPRPPAGRRRDLKLSSAQSSRTRCEIDAWLQLTSGNGSCHGFECRARLGEPRSPPWIATVSTVVCTTRGW